jgi:ribosomal protein S6--L-glutamate ligase
VVCKQTIGRKGREVYLLKEETQALEILEKHLLPAKGLLLQQFIPPAKRRDFRVLVIGGKVAAAMEMIAANGDFRSNFSLSGKSRSVHLSMEAESMAIKCAQAVGLEIAGIDLMLSDGNGLLAIEANYTPGFRGLEAATGMDVAAMIIEYAAS